MENAKELLDVLKKQTMFIRLPEDNVVFVGDTHGDFDASQRVIEKYLKTHTIVFTGDYVDRGRQSKENMDYLLKTKLENPDKLYLLLGNHEAIPVLGCGIRDFWDNLEMADYRLKEYGKYASVLPKLPLAAYRKGVLAVHGVPPDVKKLDDIASVKIRSKVWEHTIWGDFNECEGDYLERNFSGSSSISGRPQFGRDYFNRVMKQLGCKKLIRSHQPDSPLKMFNDRCITIFTSTAYLGRRPSRTIIVADLDKQKYKIEKI